MVMSTTNRCPHCGKPIDDNTAAVIAAAIRQYEDSKRKPSPDTLLLRQEH